jgi:hypothetical protein
MTLAHVNPSTMHRSPYFSQATLVDGGRLLFIGEQNGVDASGEIVEGGPERRRPRRSSRSRRSSPTWALTPQLSPN